MNDNIVAIMKHFQPPGWDALVDQVIHKKISIREGVGRMFALLPTSMHQEVVDYAIGNVTIRAGFRELLEYCSREDVHFLVTSGGIDFFLSTPFCRSSRSRRRTFTATAATSADRIFGSNGRMPATSIAQTTAACARRPSSVNILPSHTSAF